MKIAICGSMQFAKEMIETADKLREIGHIVSVPEGVGDFASGNVSVDDKWLKASKDVIKEWKKVIDNSDAVLILNYEKKGIKGYVGGNGLIETAFAYVANKKVFLLNEVPELNYKDEILAMKPIIINGDLSLIK